MVYGIGQIALMTLFSTSGLSGDGWSFDLLEIPGGETTLAALTGVLATTYIAGKRFAQT